MFKVKNYFLLQLIVWMGVMTPFTLSFWVAGSFSNPKIGGILLKRFGFIFIIGYLGVLLAFSVLRYLNTTVKKARTQLAYILLVTALVSLFSGIFETIISSFVQIFTPRELEQIKTRGFGGVTKITVLNSLSFFSHYLLWGFIYFAYLYVRNAQEQVVKTLQLNNLIKELELKTIKSRVNPHFIFNALNGIRSLVEENPSRARNAITELSNILRSSINIEKYDAISLEEEMKIVNDYIALEKMRFEDRLQTSISVDEDLLDYPIPPMIIQTLVENAIKHGISKLINGGSVMVQVNKINGELVIQVMNSGSFMNTNENKGFGLGSIHNRLKLIYQGAASFTIAQLNDNLVRAEIIIPIEELYKFK